MLESRCNDARKNCLIAHNAQRVVSFTEIIIVQSHPQNIIAASAKNVSRAMISRSAVGNMRKLFKQSLPSRKANARCCTGIGFCEISVKFGDCTEDV